MARNAAVFVLTFSLLLSAAPIAAADCQFVLGFAALKSLIDAAEGPDKVGECLEDQRFNPVNGDALQQTTGGLMVWRKLDNWTAFTDGYRTWINGPHGLQARLNTETFDWEASPPPTPTPEPTPVPDYGAWEFHDYTDLLTNVTEQRAWLEAEQKQGYGEEFPDLVMRCYVGGDDGFDVVILWHTHIGQNNDVRDGYHAISYRFDDSPVVADFLGTSSKNNNATYMAVDYASGFFPSFLFGDHQRLVVEVTKYNGLTITAAWNITGAFHAWDRLLDSCAG